MNFPDQRDRELIDRATQISRFADGLNAWVAEFGTQRQRQAIAPLAGAEQLAAWQLGRTTTDLLEAARRPVAAAIYGPSQAGKSLFMSQVLAAADTDRSPLGRDETAGAPGYLSGLSFDVDLNPQSGSNEATAMVTRFTTADRLSKELPSDYPVMARALCRAQLLCVMARGFAMECAAQEHTWNSDALTVLLANLAKRFPGIDVDQAWQRDILHAFAYVHEIDRRRYAASAQELMAAIAAQPVSREGCVELAAHLFWDGWRSLTGLFLRIEEYLSTIASEHHEPGLMISWGAVRFLLDSKRALVHQRSGSRCYPRVAWSDFRITHRDSWPVLEHCPDSNAYREPLEIIQAAMLELVVPVLPCRLREHWRGVLEQSDLLDIPGLRAGRQGAEQGKRASADTLDEQLEIVKRGKVAYLFEHYTQQLQIQSLVLLARGGNLEVTGQLKHHVEMWGRGRYGADRWPQRVPAGLPALFIGLTGVDEEFRQRTEFAGPALYDVRLAQLADALGPVLNQFGGAAKAFTNIYPLRYPGTWDANAEQRQREGIAKWEHAGKAFLESQGVNRYVANASDRWAAAMRDDDGGLSLISAGLREVATPGAKQSRLAVGLEQAHSELLELAGRWLVKPDAHLERDQRLSCAQQTLAWLTADPSAIHERIAAIKYSFGIAEGEQTALATATVASDDSIGMRRISSFEQYAELLQNFFDQWAARRVVENWTRYAQTDARRGPWLAVDVVGKLSGYLRDYFCMPATFDAVARQLWHVVSLKFRDEGARHEARLRYVRLILNDLILNPGLTTNDEVPAGQCASHRFGSMSAWVERWQRRLPEIVAAGAGCVRQIPPGNDELQRLLATATTV